MGALESGIDDASRGPITASTVAAIVLRNLRSR